MEKQTIRVREPEARPRDPDMEQLVAAARILVEQPEVSRSAPGFIGFNKTKPGDRVLIAGDTHTDPRIVEAIRIALRERGAKVDFYSFDAGEDREIEEADEIGAMMRRGQWWDNPKYQPRRYDSVSWIDKLALDQGYDLLIHAKSGPYVTGCRAEGFPWCSAETFASRGTTYPRDLHDLINYKAWEPVWERGKGGKMHFVDPEGTDLTYTLFPEYWEMGPASGFTATPYWGHLMYHPMPPIHPNEDVKGVAAGTIAHFSKPFPRILAHLDGGPVTKLEGGGSYGDAWRDMIEETKNIQYPDFPKPGLFWFWEVAMGTNPKVARPRKRRTLSTGGSEWERRRSGILHFGFGTFGPSPQEEWAAKNGILWGHLHIHLEFPTINLLCADGSNVRLCEKGHLIALDHPEVRELAKKYGDPDDMLREDWIPPMPGVTEPGNIEDYLKDPAKWFFQDAED